MLEKLDLSAAMPAPLATTLLAFEIWAKASLYDVFEAGVLAREPPRNLLKAGAIVTRASKTGSARRKSEIKRHRLSPASKISRASAPPRSVGQAACIANGQQNVDPPHKSQGTSQGTPLAKNQTGGRKQIVIMRRGKGRTLPFVLGYEGDAVPMVRDYVGTFVTIQVEQVSGRNAACAD